MATVPRAVLAATLIAALLTARPASAFAGDPPPPPAQGSVAADLRGDGWSWVLLLAGAATLAASATFALRARSDHEDWAAARDPERKAILKDRGQSRALAADITGAAGVLTAGTGALLLWAF